MSYVLLKKENKNNKRNTNGGEIFQICLNSIVPLFGEVGPCASKGILKEYSSEKWKKKGGKYFVTSKVNGGRILSDSKSMMKN